MQFLTHSVEKRFIVIVCSALVFLIAPLFGLFFYLSAERALQDRADRIAVMTTANAQALGKPIWDFDTESVRKIAATVISADTIEAVNVRDSSGSIDISIPKTGHKGNVPTRKLTFPISYDSPDGVKSVGTLTVEVDNRGVLSTVAIRDIAFIGIFALSVLIVFAAALIANRITVIRPLLKLTDAIVATRKGNFRHKVDWQSLDEMGLLADNFNDMQEELAREEEELKAAHQLVQTVYNQTPAMLYVLDHNGRISAVSDYWLVATGYERKNVIGRPFLELLAEESRTNYRLRRKPGLQGHSSASITVRFICADAREIYVLIRESITWQEGGPISTLSVMTDVTELKQAETRNHLQAITDHLTGLLNRQGFEAVLDRRIAEADAAHEQIACLFVDLDRFKWINDNLGHAAGDKVLQGVVERIRKQVRPGDAVARLGGDEFAILISAADVDKTAREIGERIARTLLKQFTIDGTNVSLSASVGIAFYPEHATTAAELIQKSDLAMYERKRAGKNGTSVFNDSISDFMKQRAGIERDIADALENDWFEAWLQPIHRLDTGEAAGFEALMRLRHPQKGILPPADIIATAEETGTITSIGNVIFEKALANLAALSAIPEYRNAKIAINLSPLQIDAELPAHISDAIVKSGIEPSRITIEITEAVLIRNNPEINFVLQTLRDCGLQIALDDFGTGFSSLSYLHRFPVDIIKIDKSFVSSLKEKSAVTRDKTFLLIEGILTIAHHIGCRVVAEGIETEVQERILKDMGVDLGQGYYFARPMAIEDIILPQEPQSRRAQGA